jgi:hypothetical protein
LELFINFDGNCCDAVTIRHFLTPQVEVGILVICSEENHVYFTCINENFGIHFVKICTLKYKRGFMCKKFWVFILLLLPSIITVYEINATIEINGVRVNGGQIHVAVCSNESDYNAEIDLNKKTEVGNCIIKKAAKRLPFFSQISTNFL